MPIWSHVVTVLSFSMYVRYLGKVQVSVSDAVYIHCRDHDTHAHTGIA